MLSHRNYVFCVDGMLLWSFYLCLNVSCSPGHCNAVVVERGYLWCKHATKLVQFSRECKSSLDNACAVFVCGDADASQCTVVQHNCFWLRLNGMGVQLFVCAANVVCFRYMASNKSLCKKDWRGHKRGTRATRVPCPNRALHAS